MNDISFIIAIVRTRKVLTDNNKWDLKSHIEKGDCDK